MTALATQTSPMPENQRVNSNLSLIPGPLPGKYQVEMVLEGGAYAVTHSVGILEYIRETTHNLSPVHYLNKMRCSSAGVLAGICFLADRIHEHGELIKYLHTDHILSRKRRKKKGHLNTKAIVNLLKQQLQEDLSFLQNIPTRFYFPIVNYFTGEAHIMSNDPADASTIYMFQHEKLAWNSIRAAISPPYVSVPVKLKPLGGKVFGDGQFGYPFARSTSQVRAALYNWMTIHPEVPQEVGMTLLDVVQVIKDFYQTQKVSPEIALQTEALFQRITQAATIEEVNALLSDPKHAQVALKVKAIFHRIHQGKLTWERPSRKHALPCVKLYILTEALRRPPKKLYPGLAGLDFWLAKLWRGKKEKKLDSIFLGKGFQVLLEEYNDTYTDNLRLIEEEVKNGEALVIQPPKDARLKMLTKNEKEIIRMKNQGWQTAASHLQLNDLLTRINREHFGSALQKVG